MTKPTKTKTKSIAAPEDVEAGKRLRAIRERKSVSRKKLGTHLDVSYQQIQKYESGLNRMPGLTIYKLHKFFEVPMVFFYDQSYRLNDNKLHVRAMLTLGSHEFENIEDSLNIQFDKHRDWIFDAIEAGIKFKFDQPTANAHYMAIRHISTKRVILMGNKALKRLEKAVNDEGTQ